MSSPSPKGGVETGGATEEDVIDISKEETDQLILLSEELDKYLDIKNTLSTPPPAIDLSPLECHALQSEEVEALKAIFEGDLVSLNDDCTCFCVRIKFLSDEIREEDVIRIWFSLPPNYPCVPPVFEIESNQSGSFTFSEADELFEQLTKTAISRLGGAMMYEMITAAQDHMRELMKKKKEAAPPPPVAMATKTDSEKEEQMEESENVLKIQEQEFYHPRMFMTLSNIISKIPPHVQITRIENVLRQDLAVRFQTNHKAMINRLWRHERHSPQQYLLSPQIAFHGTLTKSLPSIVQHGLVIPGSNNKVEVRCGSSLGLGIYLSPDPTYSLGYADSSRLIVCSVILGKVYKGGRFAGGGYNSVISDSEMEWVVFNAAQILPCYVIQVNVMNKQFVQQKIPPPLTNLLPTSSTVEEENEKEKQAKLLARVQKYLPFGYGPGRTVILEAAEIDDDEEDYGDYQLLRYANTETSTNYKEDVVEVEKSELQTYRYRDREF